MSKTTTLLSFGLLLGAVGSWGCGDDEGLEPFPTVVFVSPEEGATITKDDDANERCDDGIQVPITIQVTNTGLKPKIRLTAVNEDDETVTRSLEPEITDPAEPTDVVFEDFPIPLGDDVNLTATVTFQSGADLPPVSLTVKVDALPPPTLAFTAPDPERIILEKDDDLGHEPGSDDYTHLSDGFQVSVGVQAQYVEEPNTVSLSVNGEPRGETTLSGGAATFERITLPEACERQGDGRQGVELRAVVDLGDGCTAEATRFVQVCTGTCYLEVEPLSEGACQFSGPDADEGTSPEGEVDNWVDRSFTIRTNCAEAEILVNGESQAGRQAVEDGELVRQLPLVQAEVRRQAGEPEENTVQVKAYKAPGDELPSTSLASEDDLPTYHADTRPPRVKFSTLKPGSHPDNTLDRSMDRRPDIPAEEDTHGLQYNVEGSICSPESGTLSLEIRALGGDYLATLGPTLLPNSPDEEGCPTWRASSVTFPEQDSYEVTVTAADACLNSASLTAVVVAKPDDPTLRVASVAGEEVDGEGNRTGQLLPAPDQPPDVAGRQATVTVTACNTDENEVVQVESRLDGELVWSDVTRTPGTVPAPDADGCVDVDVGVTLPAGRLFLRPHFDDSDAAERATFPTYEITVVLNVPTIEVVLPEEGERFNVDSNPIQVEVVTENVEDGNLVTLIVNGVDDESSPTAPVVSSLARFDDVLLGPAGDNTLDARVENDYGQEADTRTMDPAGTRTVVLDLGPPRVVFGGSLADGQLSAADDPDLSDGFQVDVPLQVQDDEDSTMAEVALFVRLDGEVAEAEEPGKELVALAGGGPFEQEVVFEGVMLGRGTYHLRATAVDRAGNTVEQTQMVTVDIAVPGVTITSPLDGACAADGTATEVAVAVTDLDGAGQAVLLVDGVEGGSEAVADGQASITLDLDAGTMALQVRVDPAAGNPGFSRVHTFTVKPNAPSVEFDFTDLEEDWVDRDPGTGAVTEVRLNLAAPGETRPDEYRLDLRVLGGDLSPDQEATLTLDCGAGEEEWQATADEEGAFEFLRVTTPLEGQCQATVNTTDCAGQAAPALSTTLRVDRVPPVARVVFAFLGDDRVITPAHDKAPELEGIQKHISCYASGITPPVDVCLHRLRSDGDEARDCKQLPADEEPPNRERVALFRDVTFLPIDPEPEGGTGYAVWCSTTDPMDNPSDPTASREQVSVRTQTPKLSWVQPWVEGMEEDEVVLWGQAQDMEVDIDGFQGDFRLATENVPARTAGWLCSDHASVAGRECTGGTSHALHANAREVGADGFLRFAGIPLAEGTHNVFAEIELPGASRSPEIPVVVDVTAPTIGDFRTTSNVIPSLQDGGPDEFINMEEDEDPAAGIQAAFVADVNAGPEDCVADLECLLLLRNDRSADALGSVEFTGEAASLTVTLAEGVPQSLTAVVRDAAGNESAPSQAIPLEADGSPPSLTIVRPEDGAFLLPNDPDVSAADLPGDDVLTYAARFSPQQATSVELFLNPANEQEPVVDPDETLVGQPWTQDVAFLDGVGNALVAIAYDRASNPDREAVHVTAEAHMPTVRFLDPQQGSPEAPTRYEEDADPNAGRFQIDVTVETTNVPDGGTVEIISNWDGVVSDRRTALVVDGDTGIGTADVRCSMRHSGPHTLTARVRAAFGAQGEHEVVVDSEQDVYVHIAVLGCGIQITEPETAYINAQMAGEPGPGGEVEVEVDVRVTAADPFPCTDQMAHLYVDRVRQVALSRLVPADGIIWEGATVTLHEGDNLLEVYLGDKDQPEDALTVHVDLDPPTVAFANLEGDPAPLGVRHDLDGEQAGLQYDFTFTVTDAEGGTLVLDDDDDSHYGNADPDPDPPLGRLDELSDDDVQSLRGVTLAVGQHTLRVWVYDRAGNEGMDGPLTAVVDVTAPSAPADLEATLAHPRLPTVELTFGASSDDADGAAAVSSYDVRYAKAPITENGFDSACPYAPDVEPLAPPAEQTLQVSGPIPASGEQCPDAFRIGADEVEGTFHFAVRATDDVGNTSAVAPLADPVVGTFRQHVFDSPGPSGWGSRLAGLGDVNGDGRDDLGVTSSDFAHVVYGADDPEDSVIQEIGSGGWYGYNLAGLGDVDGDGIDDFAVGDSGTVGIFLGSDGGQVSTDPVQTIALDANWAWGNVWFESVAGAGDFNSVLPEGGARRYNDIVIGLIDAAADAQSAAFVVLGRAREDWPGGQLRVSDDAATNAANGVVRFTVGAGSGYLGVQVAGVGDGDNDGYADILVGSSHAAVGEEVDVGTAYLVRGRAYDRQNLANPPPNPWTLLADTGRVTPIRPVQGGPGGHFSESLAGGLDLTGDGLPDFSIASRLGGRVRVYDGATVEALYAAEEAAGEDPVRVDPLEVTTLPWFRAGWPFHWWTNVDGNVDEDGDPEPDLFFSTENGEVGTAGVVLRSGHRFLRRGPLFTDQAEGYGKRVAPVGRFAGGDSHVDLVLGSPNREEVILLY